MSSSLPQITTRVRRDGTYHGSTTEQLALELDLPHIWGVVVDADQANTVEGMPNYKAPNDPYKYAELGDVLAKVLEFHDAFDLPREAQPTIHVSDTLAQLRVRLLREEVEEFADAIERRDIVAIADALADVVYVAYGSAITYGIDLDAIVSEVHDSNMSKLDAEGHPILRQDGKVLKSERYRPPDIEYVLETQLPLFEPQPPTFESDELVHQGTSAAS